MEQRAILRDDMPHGRFVAELPGGVVVQAPTAEGLKQLLRDLGASCLPSVRKSWLVQEKAPVVHRDTNGERTFNDRGSRLTFDRESVTDDQILAALRHAVDKYGPPLVLTGECQNFARRMARIAADQGIEVDNPELQDVIADVVARRRAAKVIPFKAEVSIGSID